MFKQRSIYRSTFYVFFYYLTLGKRYNWANKNASSYLQGFNRERATIKHSSTEVYFLKDGKKKQSLHKWQPVELTKLTASTCSPAIVLSSSHIFVTHLCHVTTSCSPASAKKCISAFIDSTCQRWPLWIKRLRQTGRKSKAQSNLPHCDLLTNVPVTFK